MVDINTGKALSSSSAGYQYPLTSNIYGQPVPAIEFEDMEDLIDKSLALSDPKKGSPYVYRRGTLGSSLALNTPERIESQFRPTAELIAQNVNQTAMHMRALEAERSFIGLESSVLYKPFQDWFGRLDKDITEEEKTAIANWYLEHGLTEDGDNVSSYYYSSKSVKDHYESLARKELFGRDLTEDEIKRCKEAGLDNSGIMTVRDYVQNGKDFDKAFGLMERMTWANWARYNRKFFTLKNAATMGVEIGTDPLTFVPYGLAFKSAGIVSKAVSVASKAGYQTTKIAPLTGLRKVATDFSRGATIGGGQALAYSEIRNYQGITEDTMSLTMAGISFGGLLGTIGGRFVKTPFIDEKEVQRTAQTILSEHGKNIGGNVADVERISNIRVVAHQQSAISEFEGLKDKLFNLEAEWEFIRDLGTDIEKKSVRDEINAINKRIDELDAEWVERITGDKVQLQRNILEADNTETLRSVLQEWDTGAKLASDEELTSVQRGLRKLESKLPSMTIAGTISKDSRNWVIDYGGKLIPFESGVPVIDKETGKIFSATRIHGKTLYDTNVHIQNQVTHLLDEGDKALKEYMLTTKATAKEIETDLAKFLLAPSETNPVINESLLRIAKPYMELTRIIADMSTDQTKVIGHGLLQGITETGTPLVTPIKPLLGSITHNPDKFMPAVVDPIALQRTIAKYAQETEGFLSDNIKMHSGSIKRAEQVVQQHCAENLNAGVWNNPVLRAKAIAEKEREATFKRSENPNYKSKADKAVESLKTKDKAIESLTEQQALTRLEVAKIKSDINSARTSGKGTKTKEKNLASVEKRIENFQKRIDALQKERSLLGAGDETLGTTADEQVRNFVHRNTIRQEADGVAAGMVNQHFESRHSSQSEQGFDRPDHTQHRASYWDYFYKGREDSISLGEMMDTRLDAIFANYTNQMSGRLAGNEIFGVSTFREAMQEHGKWVAEHFQYERLSDLSRKDQRLIQSLEAVIKGNYGIAIKGRDTLGGKGMHAGAVEGALEVFRNFVGLTKNGFFWIYNMFETGAAVHAYGASAVMKGTPLLRNKMVRALAGEKPNAADMRFVGNRMMADELNSMNSWNRIFEGARQRYGGNSVWGKIVAGSEYAYRHSPLSKLQMASQHAPEHFAVQEVVAEMVRFSHSNEYALSKKRFGGGFINEQDVRRMGISNERLTGLMDDFKKVSYIDSEGFPRIKTDTFDSAMSPRNKSTLSIMSNYIRDEVIQRQSYIDGFLYMGSNNSEFWKMFNQFKSFCLNSTRKRVIKNANRAVYEGAYGETGMQLALQTGLGIGMSQVKTLLRYNMLSNDDAKKKYLELNYGVSSFSELDFSTLAPWMRIVKNGFLDSSWFAGMQMGASYFDSRMMANRTSGSGDWGLSMANDDSKSPAFKKFSTTFTQNIPMAGKLDELTRSLNLAIKYAWSPSKFRDVKEFRKDSARFLKTFLPNDPFVVAGALNFLSGKYD